MFIRTERLFLRPGWPEDLDDLIEALGDDALVRGVTALPKSIDELRAYLARPRKGLLPHLFIYRREFDESRLVGGIGLARAGDDIELGYWIARRDRGHGYAAEAVRAVLEQAQMLGHRRIVAAAVADDEAMERTLAQTGFTQAEPDGIEDPTATRRYVAVLADKPGGAVDQGSETCTA